MESGGCPFPNFLLGGPSPFWSSAASRSSRVQGPIGAVAATGVPGVLATYYFHNFWAIAEAQAQQEQMIQFMKNLSMMGAMLHHRQRFILRPDEPRYTVSPQARSNVMTRKLRILAFAGSTRKDSYNKKLRRIAAKAAEECGAEVTLVDLKDLPMPLFDEDLERETGMPESAAKLKALMVESDGFLIASPEYNSSITAVLKNAIDWVSRPVPNEPSLLAFMGKTAILMSASPGNLGGLRGLVHLRAILGNIGVAPFTQDRPVVRRSNLCRRGRPLHLPGDG